MQHHPKLTNWCEECPRHRTIHLEDGIKSGFAYAYFETGGSDGLMKPQPLQIIFERFQHIQCKTAPPMLFEGTHPPWCVKVCSRIVTPCLHKLIQDGQSWAGLSPTGILR